MMMIGKTNQVFIVASLFALIAVVALAKEPVAPSKLTADFTMTRTISALSDSLVSTGRLTIGGLGLLRWETIKPAKSLLVINKGRAWIHYPDLKVTKGFDIQADPMMSVLSGNLLALTSGDFQRLSELYKISGNDKDGRVLIPISAEIRKLFREIRVQMESRGVAKKVELISASGDSTVITFNNVALNPRLNASLFSEPKSN
jgi:outer membrane lipoprotein carrier protein